MIVFAKLKIEMQNSIYFLHLLRFKSKAQKYSWLISSDKVEILLVHLQKIDSS